jgi:hypothetical protein
MRVTISVVGSFARADLLFLGVDATGAVVIVVPFE